MGKFVHQIKAFHGGLNIATDPKDLSDIEISVSDNVSLDKVGRITTCGRSIYTVPGSGSDGNKFNSTDINTDPFTTNYGLFIMGTDFDFAGASSNKTFLFCYDGGNNDQILIQENPSQSNTWNNVASDPVIQLGGPITPVYYSVNGMLRIGDESFAENTKVFFMQEEIRFESLQTDGAANQAVGWRTEDAELTAPTQAHSLCAPAPYLIGDDIRNATSAWSTHSNGGVNIMYAPQRKGALITHDGDSGWDTPLYGSVLSSDVSTDWSANQIESGPWFDEAQDKYLSYEVRTSLVNAGNYRFYCVYELDDSFDFGDNTDVVMMRIHVSEAALADIEYFRLTFMDASLDYIAHWKIYKEDIVADVDNFVVMDATWTELSPSFDLTVTHLRIQVQASAIVDAYISGPVLAESQPTGYPPGYYKLWSTFLYDNEKQESFPTEMENESAFYGDGGFNIIGGNLAMNWNLNLGANTPTVYNYNRRITGGRIYFTEESSPEHYLVGEWDALEIGWRWFPEQDSVAYTMQNSSVVSDMHGTNLASNVNAQRHSQMNNMKQDTANFVDTFQSINGYSVFGDDPSAQFKTAVVHGRRVYIGNVKQSGEHHGDRLLKSQYDKFDCFPEKVGKIDVVINDGESIIKLETYADRILQYKENTLYIINIADNIEFLEDTYNFKGVVKPYHVTKTDFGICSFNRVGVYFYDGKQLVNLLERKNSRLINETQWFNFITNNSSDSDMSDATLFYIPKRRQVVIKNAANDVFIFDFVLGSWTKGTDKFDFRDNITNWVLYEDEPIAMEGSQSVSGTTGTLSWQSDADLKHWALSTKELNWTSKNHDFGDTGTRKRIYKAHISYKSGPRPPVLEYAVNSSDTFNPATGVFLPLQSDWTRGSFSFGSNANNCYSLRLRIVSDIDQTLSCNLTNGSNVVAHASSTVPYIGAYLTSTNLPSSPLFDDRTYITAINSGVEFEMSQDAEATITETVTLHGLTGGSYVNGLAAVVDTPFEVNDIAIVYRLKSKR